MIRLAFPAAKERLAELRAGDGVSLSGRLLTGRDPNSSDWITAHTDALITLLLPVMD